MPSRTDSHDPTGAGRYRQRIFDSRDIIARPQLEPRPEGGWYREVHRSAEILQTRRGPRATLTSIYFLLEANQKSPWHVVGSDELWHHVGGAPPAWARGRSWPVTWGPA